MARKEQHGGGRQKRGNIRRGSRTGLPVILVALALLVAGGYLIAGQRRGTDTASGGAPALTVTPAVYDMGLVSQAAGVVTFEMALGNTGNGDLIISEMETSCGCTRAAVVLDGRPGPWFGMRGHGEWPAGWSARLRAGQQAKLLVQYDPDAHGIYRGPIDRTILITSNDPRQRRAEVRLAGTQVP
jgi:hypothetical protein